jgi:hypothetical protein
MVPPLAISVALVAFTMPPPLCCPTRWSNGAKTGRAPPPCLQVEFVSEDDDPDAVPIDWMAVERDRQDMQSEKPATPEQLAVHLPDWAASMTLDPDEKEDYESSQARLRVAAARAKGVVEGRSWDGIYLSDQDGEGAGMPEFTAEELSEDYQLPLETVVTALLSLGVDATRLSVRQPIRQMCTNQQEAELLAFLTSADPIACREELCESTLSELAETTFPELTADELLRLCEQQQIKTVLGVETRVFAEDYEALANSAELEIAWRGSPPSST